MVRRRPTASCPEKSAEGASINSSTELAASPGAQYLHLRLCLIAMDKGFDIKGITGGTT